MNVSLARRRRGPLHLPMGLRLPALLPADRRAARAAARRPRAGAHGLGHTARSPTTSCASLRFARTAHLLRSEFRASQPLLCRAPYRRQERTAAADRPQRRPAPASSMSAPAKEPNRSRLSCATKASPQNIYHGGLGHAERSMRQEEWISGTYPRHGRYQRLRHGDRQARRPLRRTLYDVRLARKLLSGGRTCRTRRAAQLCRTADFFRRRGTHRADASKQTSRRSKRSVRIYEKICSATCRSPSATARKVSFLFNMRDFCAREHLYTGLVQNALKTPAAERLHDPHRTKRPTPRASSSASAATICTACG